MRNTTWASSLPFVTSWLWHNEVHPCASASECWITLDTFLNPTNCGILRLHVHPVGYYTNWQKMCSSRNDLECQTNGKMQTCCMHSPSPQGCTRGRLLPRPVMFSLPRRLVQLSSSFSPGLYDPADASQIIRQFFLLLLSSSRSKHRGLFCNLVNSLSQASSGSATWAHTVSQGSLKRHTVSSAVTIKIPVALL